MSRTCESTGWVSLIVARYIDAAFYPATSASCLFPMCGCTVLYLYEVDDRSQYKFRCDLNDSENLQSASIQGKSRYQHVLVKDSRRAEPDVDETRL